MCLLEKKFIVGGTHWKEIYRKHSLEKKFTEGIHGKSDGIAAVQKSMHSMQRKSPLVIPFLGTAWPPYQFPHSSGPVSDLYIPRIGPHISCSRTDRSIVGIYKSLTNTGMWILGLRPLNSFSGNICSEFSVLVLCSAGYMSSDVYFHVLFRPDDT